MNVTMFFPFLNDGANAWYQFCLCVIQAAASIYLQETWIYPMSGLVFIVED